MKQTFKDFLQNIFIQENPTILDDDLSDGFSDWVADQGVDLLIAYAEKWHTVRMLEHVTEIYGDKS